jgi:thiosulfate/3-mercaptopyruvate sulfurtransferase
MRQTLVRSAAIILMVFVFPVTAAWAAAVTPLVDAAWVKRNAGQPGVVVLDIRNGGTKNSAQSYRAGHIPGAVNSGYGSAGWRTTRDGVPGMLPPPEALEKLIGGLGIDNDTHVVIVAAGTSAGDMGTATRVYWTFKVLGHDRVSILDGGYRAYVADPSDPVETGSVQPMPKTFKANLRPEMIADYRDVLAAQKKGEALLDMRSPAQYLGKAKSGAAKRAGTIPTAVNVPGTEITGKDGRFVSAQRVGELLKAVGVGNDEDAIAFCNTGHWASLGWFAKSEILGQKNVKLYDGSMADWSARPELPVDVKAQ